MTEIKICGITRIDDALCAAENGADAVGFIFHAASPRYIDPIRAKEIIAALPEGIATVGVFVNRKADVVARTAADCGLDLIQLHGDESPEYCRRFPSEKIIKAVFPRTPEDLRSLDAYAVRAFLIDFREEHHYGGTGKRPDWGIAERMGKTHSLILAGGLSIDNIGEALAAVAPGAVDINSGIERAPGIKDHDRMKRMIEIIRARGVVGPNVIFDTRMIKQTASGTCGDTLPQGVPIPAEARRDRNVTGEGACSGSPKGSERVPGRQKGTA